MVRRLLAIVLLVGWLADIGLAQCHQLKIVDQICFGIGCKREYGLGSAVAIGRFEPGREFLLTAGHCINNNTIEVHVGVNGKWVLARVYGRLENQTGDLAVLAISHPEPLRCIPLAQQPPQLGQTVDRRGFALGGPLRTTQAVVSGPSDPHAIPELGRTVWMSQPFQQGESGGAVTLNGELVGIISGFTVEDRRGIATGVETIRGFLRSSLNGIPSCAAPQPEPPPTAPPVQPPQVVKGEKGDKGDPGRDGKDADPAVIAALEKRIAELTKRLDALADKSVTVVILDNGEVVDRHAGLKSGSTVEVDITRFKKE